MRKCPTCGGKKLIREVLQTARLYVCPECGATMRAQKGAGTSLDFEGVPDVVTCMERTTYADLGREDY